MADWQESEHPRGGDGKFGSGNDGGVRKLKSEPLNFKGKPDPGGEFRSNPFYYDPFDSKNQQYNSVVGVTFRTKGYWTKKTTINPAELDVISSQNVVNKARVEAYEQDPNASPENSKVGKSVRPTVVKYKGKYIVNDGNHRMVAAALRGEPIEVSLTDMDAALEVEDKYKERHGIRKDMPMGARLTEAMQEYKEENKKDSLGEVEAIFDAIVCLDRDSKRLKRRVDSFRRSG